MSIFSDKQKHQSALYDLQQNISGRVGTVYFIWYLHRYVDGNINIYLFSFCRICTYQGRYMSTYAPKHCQCRPPSGSCLLSYVSWCQGLCLLCWEGLSCLSPSSVPGGGDPGAPSWYLRLKVHTSNPGSSDWIGQGSTLAHPRFHLRINSASIQLRRPRSSVINAHS